LLPLAGIPIYYARCEKCAFCFAPGIASWSPDEFAQRIYNDEYALVDPDYVEVRPRTNAKSLAGMFGGSPPPVRHLDFGGGKGLLASLLREAGWNSTSYDPFVDRQVRADELGQFDFITAFEVFEHVPDAPQLMAQLRRLLAPNGLIIFSTLLSDGNIRPGQRLSWWYASPRNGHISLFSKGSLAALARANQLRFGSFSDGVHVFFTNVPAWAAHVVRVG
jgi:SAM-dependent methyltransferase